MYFDNNEVYDWNLWTFLSNCRLEHCFASEKNISEILKDHRINQETIYHLENITLRGNPANSEKTVSKMIALLQMRTLILGR